MKLRSIAVAAAALLTAAPAALAHQGDPNYLSSVTAVEPRVPGLRVEMLNRDDRLLLRNETGRDVLIRGYEDEPYARVRANGAVQVNTDSKAYHLNEDRMGQTRVPAGVDSQGPPSWKTISRTGRFEWHDHRMHWMGAQRPPQVEDPQQRTTIFDWSVPIAVGGQPGAVRGTLEWTPSPDSGGPPTPLYAISGVLVVGFAALAVARRRKPATEEAW